MCLCNPTNHFLTPPSLPPLPPPPHPKHIHSNAFLVASTRWNSSLGPGAAGVRLSEVTDWEGGGRTELGQLRRIFERELEEGDRRVWMVARQVGPSIVWGLH